MVEVLGRGSSPGVDNTIMTPLPGSRVQFANLPAGLWCANRQKQGGVVKYNRVFVKTEICNSVYLACMEGKYN